MLAAADGGLNTDAAAANQRHRGHKAEWAQFYREQTAPEAGQVTVFDLPAWTSETTA